MTDTRFSSAIHLLVLISEADTPMTSTQLAVSVGTNASYIRKLISLLKNRGLIQSHQGIAGFTLTRPPEEIPLLEIYRAVCETERVELFELHRNPNDRCIVGKWIHPVLSEQFRSLAEQVERELQQQTLADVIRNLKNTQATMQL